MMLKLLTILAIVVAVAAATGSARATFKGANGRLVYQEKIGDHYQLVSRKPDGSAPHQLTHFDDSDATWGLWSPDGTKIAFKRVWSPGKARLYTMNADGSGLHELGFKLRNEFAWFPDGKHLLVISGMKWTIVTSSGGEPRFAGIPGSGTSPCILRDGKHAAFLASVGRGDGLAAIFVAEIGGGPKRQKRVSAWGRYADKIDCSPDGTRIAFSTPHFGPPQSSNVYVMKVDGTGLKQLTHATGGTINDGLDSWSPDGRKIAFVSNRDGQYRIYTMNSDGSGAWTRVSGDGEAHTASWGTHP
jgi:TolB protein